MAEQSEYAFRCTLCDRVYKSKRREKAESQAMECEKSHGEIVYVPMLRSDIQRLLSFFVIKDESLITKTLWKTLRRYRSM